MSRLRISVVIPTRNRPDKLAGTLAGLLCQTLPASDYEIIIVDDGSQPPVTVPESTLVRLGIVRLEGVERSAARNAGANAAVGELLVFVDDDLAIPAEFLQSHLKAAEKWPGSLQIGAIRLPATALETPFGRFRQQLEDAGLPVQAGPTNLANFCAAGNMAISRSRFKLLNGFDRNLISSEDQDFALRHTASGGQIVFVPQAGVIHLDSALDIRSYCKRSEWGTANMIPFCHRYPDLPDNRARDFINGPVRWGHERFSSSIRKCCKWMLARRPLTWFLFLTASLLERCAPRSRGLDCTYRLLLGAHIFRGYREGLSRASEPKINLLRSPIHEA